MKISLLKISRKKEVVKRIEQYDPVNSWLDKLPAWDGVERREVPSALRQVHQAVQALYLVHRHHQPVAAIGRSYWVTPIRLRGHSCWQEHRLH